MEHVNVGLWEVDGDGRTSHAFFFWDQAQNNGALTGLCWDTWVGQAQFDLVEFGFELVRAGYPLLAREENLIEHCPVTQ